jgi:hypothetical protein
MKSVTTSLLKARTWFFVGAVALLTVLGLAQGGWVSTVWAGTVPPLPPPPGNPPSNAPVCAIWLRTVDAPPGAWTKVQWKGPLGEWHDVETWVAPLDVAEYGAMPHWINPVQCGTGPYRWVVYSTGKMDKVWTTSDSFYFPQSPGESLWTTVPVTATAKY